MKGKHRRYLRSLAVEMEPILHVGKAGVTDAVLRQAEDALLARELVKGRVLPNVVEEPSAVAAEVARATGAELVQVIGRNFVLYKRHPEEPRIQLPD